MIENVMLWGVMVPLCIFVWVALFGAILFGYKGLKNEFTTSN